MDLQIGVKALLQNTEGKFLLVRRSPEKYPEVEDQWDIVGGRIEPGTTLLENLKREIKEEVGLDLIEEPKLIAAQDILRIPGRHVIRLTFCGKIEGQVILDSDHSEYRWITREEFRTVSLLDRYLKELFERDLLFEQSHPYS